MDNTMNPLPSVIFDRTLSDQVAHQLRQWILSGLLKPGQRVVENQLAETMNLSRGPVRDALRILENERLVVHYPHKGTFIARLTLRDAEEIYSLREALEALAVEYAIKNATDEQIRELDHIVEYMETQRSQGYTQVEATDTDLEFHQALCRISGHSRAIAAWTALQPQIRLLIFTHRTLHPADYSETAVQWHRKVADAVRRRDANQARQVLHEHLQRSFESVAESIRLGTSQDAQPGDNDAAENSMKT
jgi:DNA-binding GntR family transcriptional regulator